jgi:hypothetical protein
MTQVATIDTTNYAAMAKAMGMGQSATEKKTSALARLRINHTPVMGQAEVKGKQVNVEVVEGGTYKLEIPDGPTYYAEEVSIRPFMQRFMYKKFVMGNDSTPNRYVKTVMGDNLNSDMKDNDGGFNCGKPSGWIEDFNSLPDTMKDLIKSIKRVRAVFGTVDMVNPTDAVGNPVDVDTTPFIYEVENRDAFKTIGIIFTKLGKMQRLPPQHYIKCTTEKRDLPNGSCFYLPVVSLDLMTTLDMDNDTIGVFNDFTAWVANYNQYILNEWSDKMSYDSADSIPDAIVEDLVDINEDFV